MDSFISKQKYPPNKFQLDVLTSLNSGTGSIAVNALAGSGKATLLVQCAELLRDMGVPGSEVMFLAFNKSFRDELNRRLPAGFSAINSHSYGNRALADAIGKRTRVDYKKFRNLVQAYITRQMLDDIAKLNDSLSGCTNE